MKPAYISINNQLIKEEEAKIHVADLAIQRGYGIFDYLKTINGKAVFVTDHFNRFYNSANALNLPIKYDRQSLSNAVNDLMQANNIPNSGIKMILTGGYSADGYALAEPNLIISQTPFNFDESGFDKGVKLITYNHQRQLAHIKTIDYLQAILLQPKVKQQLADDILYHNNGKVRECPRANFFMVKDKTIFTPKTDVLAGITRSKVLNFKIGGYTIVAEDFTLDDLSQADEAFITSSTKNIMPILKIDDQVIGNGKLGKTTTLIRDKFKSLVNSFVNESL